MPQKHPIIDEKGLEAAESAWRASVEPTCKLMLRTAIRAYLSATPAPDGMEAWGYLAEGLRSHARSIDMGCAPEESDLWQAADALSQAQSALAAMRVERDEARQVVRDTHWMAVRYADGRQSYAVGMCADALRKAYDAGWLTYSGGQPHHDLDPQYPRDGSKPEYQSVEARAETAAAQVKRLTEENEALRKERAGAKREARIKALEEALSGLEFSCDVLAGTRSAETYRRMIDVDKASEALSALDAARRAARATLNSGEKAE